MSTADFSFEFFPTRTWAQAQQLLRIVPVFSATHPAFMTITFGAGGSAREGTLEIAEWLQKESNTPVAAHMTFCCLTKTEITEFADKLWQRGVRHIVALRGDAPANWQMPQAHDAADYFEHTDAFVTALLRQHPFEISVAAYPEKHPKAPDLAADIEALKKKCRAGATRAITQFFFDNEAYYRFLDKTEAAGIVTPIIPGLVPIFDFSKTVPFAKRCGTHVPDWLHARFENAKAEDTQRIAEEILIGQIYDLLDHGINHIHFYTLNKPDLCIKACYALGLHGLMQNLITQKKEYIHGNGTQSGLSAHRFNPPAEDRTRSLLEGRHYAGSAS